MESGGSLNLHGGVGYNDSPYDGGDGGDVNIYGGQSHGKNWGDLGGNVTIAGKFNLYYFIIYYSCTFSLQLKPSKI